MKKLFYHESTKGKKHERKEKFRGGIKMGKSGDQAVLTELLAQAGVTIMAIAPGICGYITMIYFHDF